jgi:hypothetical protein
MRKCVGIVALLLLAFSVAVRAVNVSDGRILGKWKLQSERSLNGSVPTLTIGTVMTIQLDKSGRVTILNEGGRPLPNPSQSAVAKIDFSPDARIMTQTVISTGTKYVWQKQ